MSEPTNKPPEPSDADYKLARMICRPGADIDGPAAVLAEWRRSVLDDAVWRVITKGRAEQPTPTSAIQSAETTPGLHIKRGPGPSSPKRGGPSGGPDWTVMPGHLETTMWEEEALNQKDRADTADALLRAANDKSLGNAQRAEEAERRYRDMALDRDEWADALRTVACGCIPSPQSARAAIVELKMMKETAERRLTEATAAFPARATEAMALAAHYAHYPQSPESRKDRFENTCPRDHWLAVVNAALAAHENDKQEGEVE